MFGKKITLFSIMGFDIRIDLSWLIIVVLISWSLAGAVFPSYLEGQSDIVYWIMGIAGAIGLFASVTFHELSHSIVARRFGLPIQGITLFIFGGVSEMRREPKSPGAEFYMAAAGPAASIVAGVIFLALANRGSVTGWSPPAVQVIRYLGVINLVLAGFNLIPAFPLDGGRVLRAAIWKFKDDLHKSTVISARVGMGFAFLLIFAGIVFLVSGSMVAGFWWIFIGLFLRSASQRSILQSRIREALRGVEVREIMKEEPVTVPAGASIDELESEYEENHDIGIFPVLENGELKGCISRKQMDQVSGDSEQGRTAGEIAEPCTGENSVGPEQDALEALHILRRRKEGERLPVVDENRLRGMISMDDILRFLSLKMGLKPKRLRTSLK